jgi:hypothetical protein
VNDPTAWAVAIFGDMTVVQLLFWIAVIIAFITFLVKTFPIVRTFVRTIEALSDLPEAITKIGQMEENLKVLDELRPNHGGSIRDIVSKTSNDLSEHIALCKVAEVAAERSVISDTSLRELKDLIENDEV